MTGKNSLVVNLNMSSTNANLSPVVDMKRANAFAINNRLNNPTVSSTDSFTGDGSDTDIYVIRNTIKCSFIICKEKRY